MGAPARSGFTLIELLVVIAIISLLMAIALPSMGSSREQGKKALCLSNLRNIGQAVSTYAPEDPDHHVMPMHGSMVSADDYWLKRTAMWFAWGGRAAPLPFLTASVEYQLNETRPGWSARERPLTRHLYPGVEPDERKLEVFRCPSDEGYPDIPSDILDDAPNENAERPLYDTLGNSYRGSLSQLIPNFTVESADRFSLGVWGQRLDALTDPSRMLWGGEPLFYNFIGTDQSGGWPEIRKFGWHRQFFTDNQLYLDGAARPTRAVSMDDPSWKFPADDYEKLGVDPSMGDIAIHRGPDWKIDSYPTPGVRINDFEIGDRPAGLWPWRAHTRVQANE